MSFSLPSVSWPGVHLKIIQKFTDKEENNHDDYTEYHTGQGIVIILGISARARFLPISERMVNFYRSLYWREVLVTRQQLVAILWHIRNEDICIDVDAQVNGR